MGSVAACAWTTVQVARFLLRAILMPILRLVVDIIFDLEILRTF